MTNLQNFLNSVSKGFRQSPDIQSLAKIDEIMDDKIDIKLREIASELSGVFIERLADILQERGMALDGHKIVTGFSQEG